eukprot:366433-Chlamydomonas_euryale.AAC.30
MGKGRPGRGCKTATQAGKVNRKGRQREVKEDEGGEEGKRQERVNVCTPASWTAASKIKQQKRTRCGPYLYTPIHGGGRRQQSSLVKVCQSMTSFLNEEPSQTASIAQSVQNDGALLPTISCGQQNAWSLCCTTRARRSETGENHVPLIQSSTVTRCHYLFGPVKHRVCVCVCVLGYNSGQLSPR